eukprot:9590883-Ditylum_brightwellii.AAC.1
MVDVLVVILNCSMSMSNDCGLDNNNNTDDLKKMVDSTRAMKLLEQFKPESLAEATTGKPGGDSGVAFAQTEGYAPTCFNCHAKGHTVNECPKLDAAERD